MKILVSVAALLAAVPASAGDLAKRGAETKAASELPVPDIRSTDNHSWTGIWFGALAGYGISNSELSLDSFENGGSKRTHEGSVDGFGGEGFDGHLQIGFDKQIGDRAVVGLFGEAKFSNSESEVKVGNATALTVDEGNTYLAMARAGYLLNAHNMLYVAGGYFWNVDTEIQISGADTIKQDFQGLVGEVGFESRIADNVYARLAGRYYAAETETLKWGNDTCWDELDIDAGKLEVMVGVTMKMGGLPY